MNIKLILKIAALIVIVVVASLLLYLKHGFRVVGYSPLLNKISTNTPYFDVGFNNNLSGKNISISSPQGIFDRYSIMNSKDLRIFFKLPLVLNHKYQIVINSVENSQNAVIKNFSIKFTAIYQSPSSLTESQTLYLVNQQDKPNSQIYGTDLVNLLPFVGAGNEFLVNYSLVNKVPAITITGGSTQAFNDAKLWITSQGYDISKLNISYINGQP